MCLNLRFCSYCGDKKGQRNKDSKLSCASGLGERIKGVMLKINESCSPIFSIFEIQLSKSD